MLRKTTLVFFLLLFVFTGFAAERLPGAKNKIKMFPGDFIKSALPFTPRVSLLWRENISNPDFAEYIKIIAYSLIQNTVK